MGARDPETGQFVSTTERDLANRRTPYEEMVHQHIQTRFRVTDASNLSNTSDYDAELHNLHRWEPAGGLDFNELAELMEVRVWAFDCNVHDFQNTITERGLVTGEIEISSNPEPVMTLDSMPNFTVDTHDEDPVNATATGQWGRSASADTESDDPIWYGQRVWMPNALDSLNGVGMGGMVHDGPGDVYHINYARDLGGGPVYDDDDRVYSHAGLDVETMPNGPDLQVKMIATLRWGVQEFESRVR